MVVSREITIFSAVSFYLTPVPPPHRRDSMRFLGWYFFLHLTVCRRSLSQFLHECAQGLSTGESQCRRNTTGVKELKRGRTEGKGSEVHWLRGWGEATSGVQRSRHNSRVVRDGDPKRPGKYFSASCKSLR
eukprot:1029359-Amorphochlora_amoeboformis.AAC.1